MPSAHVEMSGRLDHLGARGRRGVGHAVRVEYVSRVPRPPLDRLIDDLHYLEGAPPYARLTLPPAPAACTQGCASPTTGPDNDDVSVHGANAID
jgi:hypothetical protein